MNEHHTIRDAQTGNIVGEIKHFAAFDHYVFIDPCNGMAVNDVRCYSLLVNLHFKRKNIQYKTKMLFLTVLRHLFDILERF